jgi:hypothetical protein
MKALQRKILSKITECINKQVKQLIYVSCFFIYCVTEELLRKNPNIEESLYVKGFGAAAVHDRIRLQ